ncbi:MAG: hypothetical protein NTV68_01750 [Methanomicrobiales archaeon]|nr:hypothetical protein [Methanomicrobiales archaeon]
MSSDPVARGMAGDNEEYATKLWPSFPPVQYEKQGHDVSEGGPERNEEE